MTAIKFKRFAITGTALLLAVGLSACSGQVSSDDPGTSDSGFEFGADQEAVDQAIAEHEPVTLRYQALASSENAVEATSALMFKEAIEERSGGKITLDIVWGTAVASHDEAFDALADGRLDIAFIIPGYFPDRFPISNAVNAVTQYSPSSPLVGELISNAVMSELSWGSSELLESTYEQNGLVPLSPVTDTGDYLLACADEHTSMDDWRGVQTRVSSTAHGAVVSSVGSTPVSLSFDETYEALQRGTVDCAMMPHQVAGSTGLIEVAPNIYHSGETRFTGSVPGAFAAGSSFKELPLAYQQIVFDAIAADFEGNLLNTLNGLNGVIEMAREADGNVQTIPADVEQSMQDAQEKLVDEHISAGSLDEDVRDHIQSLVDKWSATAEELAFTDQGSFEDFPEWFSADGADLHTFAERVFTESALPHRPE